MYYQKEKNAKIHGQIKRELTYLFMSVYTIDCMDLVDLNP
jgi:hypothetical protein